MIITDYARRFIGVPYIYGGKSVQGFDCSGFIQEVLSFAGLDLKGDQSAQAYYDYFSKDSEYTYPAEGALAFYGPASSDEIHHVNYLTSQFTILGAMGGDQTTVSLAIAEKQRAFVKERPISWMKDPIIIMPKYPDWVKEIS